MFSKYKYFRFKKIYFHFGNTFTFVSETFAKQIEKNRINFVAVVAYASEVGPDPDYRSRFRQDSGFFFRTRIRSQKFVKHRTRIRSQFSVSAVAGVCAVIS